MSTTASKIISTSLYVVMFFFAFVLYGSELLSAQEIEIETASHMFIPEPTQPPSDAELARVSELSEKYINGSITAAELEELKTFKSDFTDINIYRDQYKQQAFTEPALEQGETAVNTAPVEPVSTESAYTEPVAVEVEAGVQNPPDSSNSNGLLLLVMIAVLINFVLLLFILLRMRKGQ